MPLRALFVFLALVTSGRLAAAQKETPPACKAAPGACCPDPSTPRIRHCFLSPLGGAFDVKLHYPDTLLVATIEKPLRVVSPEDYLQVDARGTSILITPKAANLPSEMTVQIIYPSQRVTLRVRMAKEGDAQVRLQDPDKPARDIEIQRRVEQAVGAEKARLSELEKRLDERAREAMHDLLRSEYSRSGFEVVDRPGKPVRKGDVVVAPLQMVRFAGTRMLRFLVQNRSGKAFRLTTVKLTVDGRAATAPAAFGGKALPVEIGVDQEVHGAVELGEVRSGGRLQIGIDEEDPRRNVSLPMEAP